MRQKGNPVIQNIRGVAWEWAETPADYVLGATTCALFLSLKYHRLHPEYIYTRIKEIQGMFNLRIMLTMVDIQNHEDSIKELSKTSLINNVTIILCWSPQEAGKYLELFKGLENAAPTTIKARQSDSINDRLVDFITVPRGINKTDAFTLISNFGSLRRAVNADKETISQLSGFGAKKVERWCENVNAPLRNAKASKHISLSRNVSMVETAAPAHPAPASPAATIGQNSSTAANAMQPAKQMKSVPVRQEPTVVEEDYEIVTGDDAPPTMSNTAKSSARIEPPLSDGIAAALAKLRQS